MHSLQIYFQNCHIIIRYKFLLQYNIVFFNIEHNYITTAIFNQHWDGRKRGGQKTNLIVVHPHNDIQYLEKENAEVV